MDLGIKNKTVLITGASQGIGQNIAELFSKNKTKCILVSRNIKKLKILKKKFDKNVKGNEVFECDLTNDKSLTKFLNGFQCQRGVLKQWSMDSYLSHYNYKISLLLDNYSYFK